MVVLSARRHGHILALSRCPQSKMRFERPELVSAPLFTFLPYPYSRAELPIVRVSLSVRCSAFDHFYRSNVRRHPARIDRLRPKPALA